ncbi:endonuclease [Georgenia yuyongxinii]|uniref:Endonuclease n=1 Tax=Georgenia yuyongxinii TaxID=2589797 RepID=A0A5B8C863_9MICO|nr:endonuclease [Georgenia yuyongxinii]
MRRLRVPPGPRLRRRAADAHRRPVLHELRLPDVRGAAGRRAGTVTALRLLTVNLQHALPAVGSPRVGQPADGVSLTEAAAELRAVDADIVLVQEVDRHQPRSGRVDQAALLARELDLPHHRFAASLAGSATGLARRPRRSSVDGPAYGVALLSRYPVRSWHALRLRGGGVRLRRGADLLGWSLGGWFPQVDAGRVCLAAVVETPGGPTTVAVTHLSVFPDVARRQLARCVRALAVLPGPRVLGGDLNLPPAAVEEVTGWTALAVAPTFTNARPRTQLDHLLGDGVRPAGTGRAHHLTISDHAALSAEVVPVP